MKANFLYIILLFLIITIPSNVEGLSKKTNNSITGQVITGDATVQYASISVQIVALLPNITLISPRNVTYFTKENILLNYTSINEMAAWYSINGGSNTTITSSILFNVSSNSAYLLRLYANDTDNNLVIKNITFIANETRFNVSYDEFIEEGETTDFYDYGYEEIQNLTNITINKNTVGKISFQETINLTQCSNNLCDLSSHINISFNRIELNSSALPNFNKSAILTLYNLTFSNPRILKDGSLCSSSECTKITYSSGTLTFNVTSFSTYSAEETSSSSGSSDSSGSSSSSSSESGGGGGGSTIISTTLFTFEPNNIAINLKKGESKQYKLTLNNPSQNNLILEISTNLQNLINIEEKSINLAKGESKDVFIEFRADKNANEDIYLGEINLKSKDAERTIPVSITISSKNSLFDVKISIDKENAKVSPGEELTSSLKLFNLGKEEVKVLVKYYIKDKNNTLILTENETILVNKELNIERKFYIPYSVEPGQHILYVTIEYNSEIASSSFWFTIRSPAEIKIEKLKEPIIMIVLIIIILSVIILSLKKRDEYASQKTIRK